MPSTSTGAAVPVPPPLTEIFQDSATGGDGFRPILFGNDVFNIFHHTVGSGQQIVACTNASTGEPCPGYPKVLTYGEPPQPISTSFTPMQFVRADGKMFFPVNRPADYGVACFDLVAGVPCGYTQLSSAGTGSSVAGDYPSMIEGSAAVGTSLYFYGSENNAGVYTPILYCFDAATQSPCASGARVDLSTPANGTVVGWNPGVNGSNRGLVVQLTADGSRIFLDQAFSGTSGSQVSCFDTATQAACPGWGTPLVLPTPNFSGTGYGSFVLNPGTPGPHGICAASLGGYREAGAPRAAPREEVCVAADKSPLPPVPGPGAAVPGVPDVASLEQVTYVPQLDSSYFAFFDVTAAAPNGYAFCWNWTTNAGLSRVSIPARNWATNQPPERNPVNGGHTSDYAYTYDQATGCMWGLGDAGFLWSFDARTGNNPCRVGKQALELVSPTSFYCDAQPGHVQGWDKVRFVSTELDAFAEIRVTLLDSTGAPVPGFTDVALPLSGTTPGVLDISTIPVTPPTDTLTAQFVINAPTNDPWANGLQPFAELSFIGDPPQVCFQTTVAKICATGSISDQANVTTNAITPPDLSNPITLQVQPVPAGCTPTLTKTADQSPVTAGSPIGFRITLANPGPNALPGLTLTDALPAGSGVDWSIADQQGPATCTITGAPPTETLGCGTFTLDPGQSQTVHVTSPTAPDVCAVLDNTATATSPIAPVQTADDSVTVQCQAEVSTTIHDPAHATVTSVPAGTTVHDQATVTGGLGTPTGTVTFTWFTNATCATPAAATSTPIPLDATGVADATAFAFTPAAPGSFAFQAVYSGDGTYTASTGPCEPLTVTPAASGTASVIHDAAHATVTSVPAGTTVHDQATVTAQTGLPTPTGTVTFSWFTNGTCTAPAAATSTPIPLDATGVADATAFAFTPGGSGNFAFQAVYSGDATNTASTGPCEPLTVTPIASDTESAIHDDSTHAPTPTSTIVTSVPAGTTVHDQATVTGQPGLAAPSGTMTFSWFTNGTCTTPATATSAPVPLDATGVADAVGFPQTPSTGGMFAFQAVYSGDGTYTASTGPCEPLDRHIARRRPPRR